jgi:peptidoglycan/LPS O-acetylase OafA/YrhL
VPNGRSELRYRPYLDGVRCVAVYLVVAFHAGLGAFPGGFVGVDMFFVLSGYLVTGIMLRDLARLGRIELPRFYARRVRRILPASCLALVGTAIAYSVVATPAQMFDVFGGFRASFLYYANWYFVHQSVNYFAANVNGSPVLHFWSLAVEEQFYLLWPLGLTTLYLATGRLGRMRWWAVRLAIGTAAIASVVAAIHIGATNLDRAYYGTDTRAYQLLGGALLALTPQLFRLGDRARRVAQWMAGLAVGTLVLVASSVVDLGAISRGIVVTFLTCVLIVALENASGGVVLDALSASPVAYLGRLSYGTYLWHWPVVVIATHDRAVRPVVLFALTFTLATLLAAVSYHMLEHPIRVSAWLNRYRVPVIAAGLTTSIIGGLVFAPAILETRGSVSAGSKLLDWRVAKADRVKETDCFGESDERCTLVKGTGLRVVLMGDSHARMWTTAFEAIAKKESWTFSVAVLPRCPWQFGVQYGSDTGAQRQDCERHQANWYRHLIPALNPDVVVVAHQAYDDPALRPTFTFANGRGGNVDTPGVETLLEHASRFSVGALQRQRRRVVIIEPIPVAPHSFDPISCLSAGGPTSKCEYRAGTAATPLERFYRSLEVPGRVVSLDLDRLVCPRLPICDAVLHERIVKRDGSHLTGSYAAYLSTAIDADLRRRGVLVPRG